MKRNLRINLTLVALTLLALVLGCSDDGGNPSDENRKKSVPLEYLGTWKAADGSSVTFRNDGSGDYKSGGKSVSGGSFEIDEAAKEIRFSFMGFDAGKYKIDEPPKDDKMRLDGMEYRRIGEFSNDESEKDSVAVKPVAALSEDEIQVLAGKTIRALDRAIQQGDFSDFYSTFSEMGKKKISVEDLNKAFAKTIKEKDQYKLKTDAPLTLTSEPIFKNDGNTFDIEGVYPATVGKNVRFQLRYVIENNEWKSLGVYLNP